MTKHDTPGWENESERVKAVMYAVAEKARNRGLEEAAQVAEEHVEWANKANGYGADVKEVCKVIAQKIRALKRGKA